MNYVYSFLLLLSISFIAQAESQTNSSANVTMTTFFIPPDILGLCWDSQSSLSTDVNSSDNSYVYSSSLPSPYTCDLAVNGFGFNIPSSAVIKGIEVKIERRSTGTVTDGLIRINNTGESRSANATWSSSDEVLTFGGPTDLWGQSFTPAAINLPGFQVRFGVSVGNLSAAFIDRVQVIVHYDTPMPVAFISLEVFASSASNILIWQTSSEINSGHYDIEKSLDGFKFESIGTVKASANSEEIKTYQFEDLSNEKGYYYRIKETGLNGVVSYSSIIYSSRKKAEFNVFPTLLDKEAFVFIDVNEANQEIEIEVLNLRGENIYNYIFQAESPIHKISLPEFESGTYFLKLKNRAALEVFRLVKP